MTNRAIFNRRYTSFQPAGTEVWLVNGSSQVTFDDGSSIFDFTAGADLIQGETVYVSGALVFPASAASGVPLSNARVIGIATEAAATSATVPVNLDSVVLISQDNLIHETAMVPGEYYYLSNVEGKLTRVDGSPSGITMSGGYQFSTVVGLAASASELDIEIAEPIVLSQ